MEKYIVGIDPGPCNSGLTILDTDSWGLRYAWWGNNKNLVQTVISVIPTEIKDKPLISYERMRQYEIGAGASVFESCKWYGRFVESFYRDYGSHIRVMSLTSPDVKLALLGLSNPSNAKVLVKRALCERFPQSGNGSSPAVGTKACPGPLFQMRSSEGSRHCWDALAVCVVTHMFLEQKYTGDIQEEEPCG